MGLVKNQYFIQGIDCRYLPVRDPYTIGDLGHECLLYDRGGYYSELNEYANKIQIKLLLELTPVNETTIIKFDDYDY